MKYYILARQIKLNREMTIVVYMQAFKLKRSQASRTDIFRAFN